MNNQSKRVIVYARVSSDRQDVDLSITAQLKALREYAARNGYTVIKEFVDEAESGRSTARPAFREMISLARSKHAPFEIILVWKLSRFARNREDSIIYKSLLRKQGIQVVSINEHIEDTPTGRLMEGIIEVIDEFYSSNLAQDITRGLRENASRGFFNGSRAAFGYMRKKIKDGEKSRNTLEPDPDKAPIIKRIFDEITAGKGLKEIAKGLNKDGVLAPAGGKWGKQRLHKILINEAYIGRLVYGKRHESKANLKLPPVVKDNAWPAIIDQQMFEKAQSALNSRAPKITHPRVTSSNYLLSGLIKCHKCGAAYIGYGAKSGKFHYYVCGTTYSKGKDTCPSQHLPKEKIERYITDKVKGYILTDENLTELVRLSNIEIDSTHKKSEGQLAVIDREAEEWEGRLDRIYDFIETKTVDSTRMAQRLEEVQDKIAQLKRTRLEVEESQWARQAEQIDPQRVLAYVHELRDFLDTEGLFERKSFLRSFLKSIEADDAKMTINYTLPLPPDNSSKEVVSVLDIVPPSPPIDTIGRTEVSSILPVPSFGRL
jgi:site-specific DNA recombinase